MAYATVIDVQALAPGRPLSATSIPSATQVVGYLTETAAVLDGILAARGYSLPVPITATVALELLEHYNAIGAWSLVENGAQSSVHQKVATTAWENAQKMLRDGLIVPQGLTMDTTHGRPRAGAAATPMFSRTMEF